MRLEAFVLLVFVAFPHAVLHAAETKTATKDNDELPSAEFLEYLGGFETEDGQWIDPMQLEQVSIPDNDKQDDANKDL